MLPKILPTWLYHETEPAKLVQTDDAYSQAWEDGWRTPEALGHPMAGIATIATIDPAMIERLEDPPPHDLVKRQGWPKGKKRKP